MKTPFLKKLIGLTLSVFSITVLAQCPTITSLNVALGANGTATVNPVLTGTLSSGTRYYWQASPSGYSNTNMFQMPAEFIFPTNGVYSVCFQFNDTINGCMDQSCSTLTITNMTPPTCTAGFTAYTDSNCVTRFINTSTGNNLTYGWTIDGVAYTSANPMVNLPNGNYNVFLQTYYGNQPCDSISHTISVGCSGTNTVSCQANFTFFTDSNCVVHLTNTSTGNNLSYEWYELTNNGNTSTLISTATSPTLNLPQGYIVMQLATFSNGTFCDSATNYVYINCNNPTTSCVAYSHFIITQDTLNPVSGQYYAYTNSSTTGNASYLWDFGDGTTSTQQYPLHQYAVPGQYVVCLTINGSYTSALGTATCTDTYCDSSSVHRMAAGFQMYHLVVVPQTVTSIKQTEKEIGLNAFPNPITDELTIESTTTNDSQITYMLVDALGRIVLTGVLNDSKTTINTSNLEKGFYNLSISNEKRSSLKTIKLVK